MKNSALIFLVFAMAACNNNAPQQNNSADTARIDSAMMSPEAPADHTETDVPDTTASIYDALMGKDISEVLKTIGMTDTAGKTFTAKVPQVGPNVRYLILTTDMGDQLGFDKGKLALVFPK